MRPFASLFVIGAMTAGYAAFAAGHVADTDGDGVFSMEELQAAYPELTEDLYVLVDVDGDGTVSAEELEAAEAAGTLPRS